MNWGLAHNAQIGRRILVLALGLGLAAVVAAQAATARYRPREGASSPIITLTNAAGAPRTVEARMAKFILLLQANDRAAAARLLSRRVNSGYRRGFLDGKRLVRDSTEDFALVYFLPAIRVRSRGISQSRAVVRVEPLTPHALRSQPIGFIDVPMHFERGQWQVNPTSAAVPNRGKGTAGKKRVKGSYSNGDTV